MSELRTLKLRIGSVEQLARHVALQLDRLYPDCGLQADVERAMVALPAALERMRPVLAAVRAFTPDTFDHFNSLQYTSLLYLLGNELWRRDRTDAMAERLFCLNRTLNSIDLFPAITLPEVFFISHGLGSVLGNVQFGDRLVVFQHVTVGRIGDDRPMIGSNVVLYPGATVTGRSVIGNNSVVAAGTVVHNQTIPDDCIVGTRGSATVVSSRKKDYIGLYLRPRP
jgi:serine O-acetyltransferase